MWSSRTDGRALDSMNRVADGVVHVEWLRVPTASEHNRFVPLDHEG